MAIHRPALLLKYSHPRRDINNKTMSEYVLAISFIELHSDGFYEAREVSIRTNHCAMRPMDRNDLGYSLPLRCSRHQKGLHWSRLQFIPTVTGAPGDPPPPRQWALRYTEVRIWLGS